MCTVIVSHDPSADVPLLVAALRDEMTDRAWEPPARHWPERPGLLGGRDRHAGGTWLAAHPAPAAASPRLGAVLNGRVTAEPFHGRRPVLDSTVAPARAKRSRGELPLLAADSAELRLDGTDLDAFDPFHLLRADAEAATLSTWDGADLTERALPRGVSVIVNTGLDAAEPRAQRFAPLFAHRRPRPDAELLRTATDPYTIWGAWAELIDTAAGSGARTAGTGSGADDPSAIVARVELDGGRVWATSSATLLALTGDGLRYAFTDSLGDPHAWRMVH
ncbi:NRDE family protein [Salinactinospora qingdaonensis]|uniref:NRDE family protein n=1 Tax=Salinactinospora qingdaonensis TaxID=702744 RepID=A0ABP7F3P6_9ACTN